MMLSVSFFLIYLTCSYSYINNAMDMDFPWKRSSTGMDMDFPWKRSSSGMDMYFPWKRSSLGMDMDFPRKRSTFDMDMDFPRKRSSLANDWIWQDSPKVSVTLYWNLTRNTTLEVTQPKTSMVVTPSMLNN